VHVDVAPVQQRTAEIGFWSFCTVALEQMQARVPSL
jgi:hypothetical protein